MKLLIVLPIEYHQHIVIYLCILPLKSSLIYYHWLSVFLFTAAKHDSQCDVLLYFRTGDLSCRLLVVHIGLLNA